MRELKIGVGGGGGRIFVAFRKYVKRYIPSSELYKLYESYVGKIEEDYSSLYKGKWIDLADGDPTEAYADTIGNDYHIYKITDPELNNKIKIELGYTFDVEGVQHRPETQMLVFAISEVKDHVCKKIYNKGLDKLKGFDSLIFFVVLGGGTGTGIVPAIIEYIRHGAGRRETPAFVVAVLSGKEDETINGIRTQGSYHRRSLNVLLALSDLIKERPRKTSSTNVNQNGHSPLEAPLIDGLILIDNDRVAEIINNTGEKAEGEIINEYVVKALFPMFEKKLVDKGKDIIDGGELRREFTRGTKSTPILVPCYKKGKKKIEKLIEEAITSGELAKCDVKYADALYVFTRGFQEEKDVIENKTKKVFFEIIRQEEDDITVKAWRTRKSWGQPGEKEVLILLRNPGLKKVLIERVKTAKNFVKWILGEEKLPEELEDYTPGKLKNVKEDLENFYSLESDRSGDTRVTIERNAQNALKNFMSKFKKDLEELEKKEEEVEFREKLLKFKSTLNLDITEAIRQEFEEIVNKIENEERKKEEREENMSKLIEEKMSKLTDLPTPN